MKKNLRDYQQDVLELIRDEIRNGNKRILVFACTGFGKTILSKTIAENSVKNGKRVLFTNHRIQLSGQSANVFSEINPNIIQGKNTTDNGSLLTVATIQSLYQKEPFDVVIIDEVHYAYESKLIQRILNANPNAIIIGLSATPFDENGCIIDGFNAVIDKYQTEDLIKLGYLTPFNCFAPINLSFTDNLDVEIQSVLDGYLKESNGKKFVGFGRSIEHCHQLKEAFRLSGTKCEVIDQSVNDKTRDKYLKQLKDNQLMGLFSVEILTTGFDEPSIECVIFACLASSIKKYIQCAGRGIRMIEGKKECILLDFYGNIELHGMPDQRLKIIKKTKISKVIDRILKLDVVSNEAEKIEKEISESKMSVLF